MDQFDKIVHTIKFGTIVKYRADREGLVVDINRYPMIGVRWGNYTLSYIKIDQLRVRK